MRGQLLVSTTNFDQTSGDYLDIYVNNVINKRLYLTSYGLYSCPLYVGDVVRIEVTDVSPIITSYLNLIRRDYTTDDEGGNNGIVDTTIAVSVPDTSYTFTATTVNSAYDFEYRLENTLVPPPTPYPTATSTPTPTFTASPTPSPTPSPSPSPTMTMTPTPSPTMTGTATPTPTVTGTPTPTPTTPSIGCYDLSTIFTGTSFSGLNDVIQTNDYSFVFGTSNSGSTYGATSIGSYVKLNNNTGLTINTGFTLDTSNDWITITKIHQLSSGKYIIAGASFSGKNLRRLNSDGTDDTSFTQNVFTNPSLGLNGWITDFDVQSDDKVIAVGYFNTINGSTYEAYVRLTTSGSIDTSFYSGGTGSGFSGNASASPSLYPEVLGVKIQPDNNILFYGSYTGYTSSTSYSKITRLTSTGTIDTTFSGSTTFSTFNDRYSISALLYTSTNKMLLRGFFKETAGGARTNIVMFNNDGTIDTSFVVTSGIQSEYTQPSCNPIELSSGSYIVPCSNDNDPTDAIRYNGTGFGGIIVILPNGSIDSYQLSGTWNCADPAPFWPTQTRRMYFTKIIIDVNGNYVLTYRYSPTTTEIKYNNPTNADHTNGGYAILGYYGAILKC